MKKILKIEDVMKIGDFLAENGYNDYSFTISTKVDNKDTLDKINEDFFYKLNGDVNEKPEYGDSVRIKIGGIEFTYEVNEDN